MGKDWRSRRSWVGGVDQDGRQCYYNHETGEYQYPNERGFINIGPPPQRRIDFGKALARLVITVLVVLVILLMFGFDVASAGTPGLYVVTTIIWTAVLDTSNISPIWYVVGTILSIVYALFLISE